jgi:hypothetical protein
MISICGSQANGGSAFAFSGNATHGNGPSICVKNEVGSAVDVSEIVEELESMSEKGYGGGGLKNG